MSAPRELPPERVLLGEEAARAVLLVRALEEADRDARVLDAAARRRAGAAAAAVAPAGPGGEPEPAAFLAARAHELAHEVARRHPLARRLASGPSTARTAALAAAAGVGFGLATNLLGPERSVHVLWNPVLLLVAWNLVVYVALLARAALPARADGGALAAALPRFSARVGAPLGDVHADDTAAVLARARVAAAAEGTRALGPLRAARLRAALHVGAMAAALGALGGTYLRGLVLEYRATWESTFLSEAAAERALGVLLGPARALGGLELPPLATLRAPEYGPAAPWIHALALTVLLAVVVPRGVLALAALGRARRLARAVPVAIDAPYYRRLLAPARGEGVEVVVVPYATELAGRALDGLRTLVAERDGARASVRVVPALAYGEGGADVALGDGAPRVVALFGLHQTPEAEVHGRFLAELRARVPEPLVLVDGSRYRARLASEDARRLDERRRAWDAVARDAGCAATHVELEGSAREAAAG